MTQGKEDAKNGPALQRRTRLAPVTLVAVALAGCAGDDEADPGPAQRLLQPISSLATQNAGTTPFLDLLGVADYRQICEDWYENNLCTGPAEEDLAALLAEELPDVLMLQEVWDQRGCGEEVRPAAADQPPFSCSLGTTGQPERILPAGYRYGCAAGYPDNCIAFRPEVFEPEQESTGEETLRDVSGSLVSLEAECGVPGRIAWLPGRSATGRTVLVVFHTIAGLSGDDKTCRARQLEAARVALGALPVDTTFYLAGDFNFDPVVQPEGEDAIALQALVDQLSLVRLPDDGDTHRIFPLDYDQVYVSRTAVAANWNCKVQGVDPPGAAPFFDHAQVICH